MLEIWGFKVIVESNITPKLRACDEGVICESPIVINGFAPESKHYEYWKVWSDGSTPKTGQPLTAPQFRVIIQTIRKPMGLLLGMFLTITRKPIFPTLTTASADLLFPNLYTGHPACVHIRTEYWLRNLRCILEIDQARTSSKTQHDGYQGDQRCFGPTRWNDWRRAGTGSFSSTSTYWQCFSHQSSTRVLWCQSERLYVATDKQVGIHPSFVLAKCTVAPMRQLSIPYHKLMIFKVIKLELTVCSSSSPVLDLTWTECC